MMPHAAWMSRYWIIRGKQRQTSWNNELGSFLLEMTDNGLEAPLRCLVQKVITINSLLVLYRIILIQYAADPSSKIVNKSRNTPLFSFVFLFFVDGQPILQISPFTFFRAAAEPLATNRLRACLTQGHWRIRTHDVLRANARSSAFVRPSRSTPFTSMLCSALCLKLLQQPLCAPQFTAEQPCIFPAYPVFRF